MTNYLVHFTSGDSLADAFDRFLTIVAECRLLGGCGMIRGSHLCVCLSEAPLPLPNGLVNPDYYSRYSPFGLLFTKQWVFEQGGRPVIYQTGAEYDLLPEGLRWLHVRYEPPVVDFTWEREWRVNCAELSFDPGVAALVLPSRDWVDQLIEDHDEREVAKCYWYAEALGLAEDEAWQYREGFPWRVIYLDS